ncbi:hypothetical protein PENTCL1PPCAC_11061, partial [Pristionchus entomophagus]
IDMTSSSKGYGFSRDSDTVAVWHVPLQDKVHKIEFEHGTTTGRRSIKVDGKEIIKRDWMFKLVGKEHFMLHDSVRCAVTVEAIGTFAYEYSLEVGGKTYEKFREEQSKKLQTWHCQIAGSDCRICLDKQTMDVWANGIPIETTGEFGDEGTETHFQINNTSCKIVSINSGKRVTGVVHELYVGRNHIKSDPIPTSQP